MLNALQPVYLTSIKNFVFDIKKLGYFDISTAGTISVFFRFVISDLNAS